MQFACEITVAEGFGQGGLYIINGFVGDADRSRRRRGCVPAV